MSRLCERIAQPIRDEDRPRLFALVAAALLATAGTLTLIAPAREPAAPPVSRSASTADTARRPIAAGARAAVIDAARAFTDDYLAFLGGNSERRPPTFAHASPRLQRRLAGYQLRTSPAGRTRRPRVLRLDAHRIAGGPRWVVTATIADGAVASYPVELVVAVGRDRRPVVTGLGEE